MNLNVKKNYELEKIQEFKNLKPNYIVVLGEFFKCNDFLNFSHNIDSSSSAIKFDFRF